MKIIIASILIAILSGCAALTESPMSNAKIIMAKEECVRGGMDYILTGSNAPEWVSRVVCSKPFKVVTKGE